MYLYEDATNASFSDYPATALTPQYNFTEPWADFIWHEKPEWNLGDFMETNVAGEGTDIVKGNAGLIEFVHTYTSGSLAANVTHYNDSNSFFNLQTEDFPVLLHIDAKCIPDSNAMEQDTNVKLVDTNNNGDNFDTTRINNSTLGHTVVALSLIHI